MFNRSIYFNQPLNDWDVSKCNVMQYMFNNATSFNQSLANWNITSLIPEELYYDKDGKKIYSMTDMLNNCGMDIDNYNNTLQSWSEQNVKHGVHLGAKGLYYTNKVAHDILTNKYGWIITGDTFTEPVCYSRGTKILCDTGYIPVEQLEPGTLVKTHGHGYREVELVGKGSFRNDQSNWKRCMYVLPKKGSMTDDLIVTGGHGILKQRLSSLEIERDRYWYSKCGKHAKIDNMYLVRAGKSPEFKKVTTDDVYEYYHFSLKGPSNRRYPVWANGVLTESAFKRNIIS
jgi:hypothetical protein